MSKPYYVVGPDRAAQVNALFSAIARRYDFINDLQSFGLHRWWKRRLIRLARPKPGDHALDLCCGTGDVAFLLARKGAAVVGVDFNPPMLEIAGERQRKSGESSVRFVCADANQLPLPNESFDLVTISYGLRNLASVEGGLREMLRVLKPGGRLLVLDFGKPDNWLWRRTYFAYLRGFVPILGRIFCGDAAAYAYILESLEHYPAQKGVATAMEALGCQRVRVLNFLGGVMSINSCEKAA